MTRDLYKDLVTVFKDSDTNEIKLASQVYRIEGLESMPALFPEEGHP
jgi:hypothetical protein